MWHRTCCSCYALDVLHVICHDCAPDTRAYVLETVRGSVRVLFVDWLLNVPATCECISGTDLLRQLYVLPH